MKSYKGVLAVLFLLSSFSVAHLSRSKRRRRASTSTALRSPLGSQFPLPSTENCTWVTYDQTLDHFAKGATRGGGETFSQRLCIFDGFLSDKSSPSVVLFYTGNESPVEEYVNNSGLMWEVGSEVDALLVFAEHRYEGESVPDQVGMPNCASYVTVEQALADYAAIIHWLRGTFTEPAAVPFVAVGGSYGGMLSSWLRIKYPFAVAGAIAASAPIFGFAKESPELDGSAVATSRGFSAAGGATDTCTANLLAAWPLMKQLGTSPEGRQLLESELSLCEPLGSSEAVDVLISSIQGTFFDLAEADYPFESTYITSAVGPGLYPLPAWPMRVACEGGLNDDLGVSVTGDVSAVNFAVSAVPLSTPSSPGVAGGAGGGGGAAAAAAGGGGGGGAGVGHKKDSSDSESDTDDILVSVNVEWAEVSPSDEQGFSIDDVKATGVPGLLRGVAKAWAVWCNVTGELTCLSAGGCLTGSSDGDYSSSSSSFSSPSSSPFSADTAATAPPPQGKKNTTSTAAGESGGLLLVSAAVRGGGGDGGDGEDDSVSEEVCTSGVSTSWNSLCCNDDLNLINYLVQGVGRDVYWPPNVADGWQDLDSSAQLTSLLGPEGETTPGCRTPNGVTGYPSSSDPWSLWLNTQMGGLDIGASSNIIFSNGLLDPWSAAGVYPGGAVPPGPGAYDGPALLNLTIAQVPGSLQSLILDLGAHHLDLMFMDDNDPPCADEARSIEKDAIVRWANEDRARRQNLLLQSKNRKK